MGRGRADGRSKRGRGRRPRPTSARRLRSVGELPAWAQALAVFATALAARALVLPGALERRAPIAALFFGDSVHFLEQARHTVEGLPFSAGLPFHPPLTGWLLVPLWWLLPSAEAVFVAAKLLMAALDATALALLFLLLRERIPHALPIFFLMPFAFGDLLLAQTVNSEAPYRLLLVLLLQVGWRRPWLAGALHAAAALTRAEHLPFALALLVLALWRWPERRRATWITAGVALACLLPWTLAASLSLRDYNQRHAEELPVPLPTLVPVSFYGPLNFALAQREEEIHFSRSTLPPAPEDPAALDPRFPPHHAYIVDGYRLGLEAIAADPMRFLGRSGRKLAHSLRALGQGWTWRDLPHDGVWVRRPVDMAHARQQGGYLVVALALIALGAWRLREDRTLLAVGATLLAYRLLVNTLFFPYLRSMMVVSPFWLLLLGVGLATPFRRWGGRAVAVVALTLAVFHGATAWRDRAYSLSGERDEAGVILDDLTVEVTFEGYLR